MVRATLLVMVLALCASTSQAVTRSRAILSDPIEVAALGTKSIQVVVTDLMPGTHLTGEVRASGGTGNDIEVFIMPEREFANWTNGHESLVLFQSGRKTLVPLDVELLPGSYRLVFSNTFSSFTPKVLKGSVALSWSDEDGLPAGSALKGQIKFIKLPEFASAVNVPIKTAQGQGAVSARAVNPPGGPFSVTVKRPSRNSSIERVVGTIEVSRFNEAGTIDIDSDGSEEVLLTGESAGSGATSRELVLVSPTKLAIVSLSIFQTFTAGSKPQLTGDSNFNDPKFGAEQSFLQRLAEAYLPSAAEEVAQEDDPKYVFDTWVKDNGSVTSGPMTIRRLKGPPAEQGSVLAELKDGSITYLACFKAGVLAVDRAADEHYAVFYPKDHYSWPTALKKLGPFVLIGTNGEGLAIVDTRDFSLRRVPLTGAASTVERIDIVGTKIRVNGVFDVDAPSY